MRAIGRLGTTELIPSGWPFSPQWDPALRSGPGSCRESARLLRRSTLGFLQLERLETWREKMIEGEGD